jgi:hypothetical protein
MAGKLSGFSTGRTLHPGNITLLLLVLISLWGWVHLIGTRTRLQHNAPTLISTMCLGTNSNWLHLKYELGRYLFRREPNHKMRRSYSASCYVAVPFRTMALRATANPITPSSSRSCDTGRLATTLTHDWKRTRRKTCCYAHVYAWLL